METAAAAARFDDLHTARRACLNALDLIHDSAYYDAEKLADFISWNVEAQMMLAKNDLTVGECEDIYTQILTRLKDVTLQRGDMPRVYITTSEGLDKISKGTYSKCIMAFVPPEDEPESAVQAMTGCEIKLRGQSTASAPKKPFTFRLPYKTSLFGMDAGKRWILLANMYDKSLMRNHIAFTLADALGCPYNSQSMFVEVWVDGEFQGNYQLVEPVTDGSERVDIDTENENEFLLEIDGNRNDTTRKYVKTSRWGVRFKVDKPADVSEEKLAWLEDFLNEAEDALHDRESDRYREYFDVDSFINAYITLEYCKNLDANGYSTRFFIKDNKIYAGPLWDFDLSAGNVAATAEFEGYWIYRNLPGYGDSSNDSTRGIWNKSGWFSKLFKQADFAEEAAARFAEVRPILENIYRENELGPSMIDSILAEYEISFRRNYEETDWDINVRYSPFIMEENETMSFDDQITYLKEWFEKRLAWLEENFPKK